MNIKNYFEEAVKKYPNRIAVAYEGEKITYARLNEMANSVAGILLEHGVKPDDVVPIIANKSLEMIIGILGIMKSGGAYLPIDPFYPEKRVQYILEDCGSDIFLVTGELYSEVKFKGCKIDLTCKDIYINNKENCNIQIHKNNLVYVIYTSGTTGNPKGVMVEHRSLFNISKYMVEKYNLSYEDRSGLFISFSFDLFGTEVWPYLMVGAAVYIVPQESRVNIDKLAQFYEDNRITMTILPTQISEYFVKMKNSSLRYLLAGGEKMKFFSEEDLKTKGYTLVNIYGPTETTIFSSDYIVDKEEGDIPIGKPIDETQLYILDEKMKPVDIGVKGELYVGGAGLARGYLNKKELTEKKFVSNPFKEGERIYKTGDLVKWRADGNIQFIKRIDEQVKINGYRIELGELEKCLVSYKGIIQGAVVGIENQGGKKNLCAYYVSDEEIDIKGLKEHFHKEVPYYMVPSFYRKLESMPLTVNGKIDRKALEEIKFSVDDYKGEEPKNQCEVKLQELWCEILLLDHIGVEQEYFDIGGNSLNGTILISSILKEFGVQLELKDLFENGTIRGLSKRILKGSGQNSAEKPEIKRVENRERYFLSDAQKRMFMIQKYNEDSTAYNETFVYKIIGEVELSRVEEIIDKLLQRHEALRSHFSITEEGVVQKFHEKYGVNIQVQEIENIEREIQDFIRPFNLEVEAPFRCKICIYKEFKYIMIDVHHIAVDGYSMDIIHRELEKLINGEELDEIQWRYRDYAEFQSKIKSSKYIIPQKEYWMKTFKNKNEKTEIIGDFERKERRGFLGDRVGIALKEGTSKKIMEKVKEERVTLPMFFMAALNILLYKYTGKEEVVIGSPVSGRNHNGLDRIVGMFVNTVAVRNTVQGDMSGKKLLRDLKKRILNVYENQDYQFDNLIEELGIHVDKGRNPLFDVMFNFKDTAGEFRFENEKLKISSYKFKDRRAKFDLSFNVQMADGGINLEIEYDTELFKRDTAVRIIGHYNKIIEEISRDMEKKISNVDMLLEGEREEIIKVFNNTRREYKRNSTVHDIFTEQVKDKGHKIAVEYKESSITYRELEELSQKVACKLNSLGAGKNSVVAVTGEKNLNTIIGMLGILKAGGVYLPLEKNYPQERKEYMMKDSGCEIVISTDREFDIVKEELNYFSIEEILKEKTIEATLAESCCGDDSAYVIYTSGTTGKPKGVLGNHRNILRLVKNITYVDFKEEDRILQTGSISFDASTFEIWGALLNGLTLHMTDMETVVVPELLEECIESKGITILWLTSELFNQVADYDASIFRGLRYLMAGGDVLSARRVNKVREACPKLKFLNGYGPTENTTFSTLYLVDKYHEKKIPIGKPNDNSTAVIVDRDFNLVPIGVKGELCVGGDGLAWGYLNKEKLTEERFVENPFMEGERLYRTGDTARWMADGNIEFFERMDNQVKIRGFRIELEEIENRLMDYPGIKSAGVVVQTKRGNKEIQGFITGEKIIDREMIRRELQKQLPGYMIPNNIVQIEKMPVTYNGKLDRDKLRETEIEVKDKNIKKPSNLKEEFLLEIFSEVMGIDRVGVNDNILELGANSLKLMIFTQRIKSRYDIEYNQIFQYPYLEKIAEILKDKKSSLDSNRLFHKIRERKNLEEMCDSESILMERKNYLHRVNEEYKDLDFSKIRKHKYILLTGATGYLGSNVLRTLLESTESGIIAVVRGENRKAAEVRLEKKMDYYFGKGYFSKYKERVRVIKGDITEEYLGLSQREYYEISQVCTSIINTAADVRHYGKYETFYKANVQSVERLIDFALEGEKKELNHISTISVASGKIQGERSKFYCEYDLDMNQVSHNSYVKTKMEAEKKILRAFDSGLKGKIFRVGNIVFNSRTGKCQENISNNAFYQRIKSFMNLGIVPNEWERNIDMSFVDKVSEAVVSLSELEGLSNEVFHIVNHNVISIGEFGRILNDVSQKWKVEELGLQDFFNGMEKLYSSPGMKSFIDTLILHSDELNSKDETFFHIESYKTRMLLEKRGFKWEKISEKHIKRMIEYGEEIEFWNEIG